MSIFFSKDDERYCETGHTRSLEFENLESKKRQRMQLKLTKVNFKTVYMLNIEISSK